MPILSSNQIEARSRGRVTGFKKSYLRKSPYAGLGKKSRVNGLIKTKSMGNVPIRVTDTLILMQEANNIIQNKDP